MKHLQLYFGVPVFTAEETRVGMRPCRVLGDVRKKKLGRINADLVQLGLVATLARVGRTRGTGRMEGFGEFS